MTLKLQPRRKSAIGYWVQQGILTELHPNCAIVPVKDARFFDGQGAGVIGHDDKPSSAHFPLTNQTVEMMSILPLSC